MKGPQISLICFAKLWRWDNTFGAFLVVTVSLSIEYSHGEIQVRACTLAFLNLLVARLARPYRGPMYDLLRLT